jgi:hypothetical protein
MEDVRLTYNDLIIYSAIANTILGLLFGIFPLVVGIKSGNRKMAYIGLIVSIVGGFLLSVFLAFPAALICTFLAFRSKEQPVVADGPPAAA